MTLHANSISRRVLTSLAGTALALGTAVGLAGCDAGAQTPYPEQTSTDTATPTPIPSDSETPVPKSSDDSGTLGG
ncbi:hypothetical protein [Herbiconiux sp. YIM B11900]|uniref:hypothetical protein n=1 Tax=Herbiconiux sp. YIM B11900 TaxID=3404131 RepID=UPI003F8543F0